MKSEGGPRGEVVEGSDAPWCWALKMGYARDRVIACARVKAAELAKGNLGACAETRDELSDVARRARSERERAEAELARPRAADNPRTAPAVELNAKRLQWERASADVADAHRQQPTYLCTPVVLGSSAREIEAWADDPALEKDETHEVAAQETARAAALARDAKMGTEMFVSIVFPDADHRRMRAGAAAGAALQTGEHAYQFPAVVSVHNATGALRAFPWPLRMEVSDAPPSAFVTDDAAELLASLHALIVAKEGGGDYLLLEHPAL